MFVETRKKASFRFVLIIMYFLGVVSLFGCGQKAPLEHPPVKVENTEPESETERTEEDKPFILDPLIK